MDQRRHAPRYIDGHSQDTRPTLLPPNLRDNRLSHLRLDYHGLVQHMGHFNRGRESPTHPPTRSYAPITLASGRPGLQNTKRC